MITKYGGGSRLKQARTKIGLTQKALAAELDLSPAYISLIETERGKIDFLTVCTTNESHYAIAKAALEAGIDVFCEKPLSLTLKEAEELGAVARRKRRMLGIPFTYTGYPMVKLARDLVKGGELVLKAEGVASPKKVRYLYEKPWNGRLFAVSGLPLGPFEIDVK